MKYHAFISYASTDTDIVENLRGHLDKYGVKAWVYSIDSTLAADMWVEIKKKITDSDLVIFVVSENTHNANGQKQELNLVLEKVMPFAGTTKIMPIFISGTDPLNFPEVLRNKNGFFLDGRTVKSVAWEIASKAFPSLVKNKFEMSWNYPIPGEWLEISNLDGIVEQYFDIGDKLYFRAISPMGLLECYSPKIDGLFWIAPDNVKPSSDIEAGKELEDKIPQIYTISCMIEIQLLGWKVWQASQKQK